MARKSLKQLCIQFCVHGEMNAFKVSTGKTTFRLNITLLADAVSHLILLCLNCRLHLVLCLVKMIVLNQKSIFSELHPVKLQM